MIIIPGGIELENANIIHASMIIISGGIELQNANIGTLYFDPKNILTTIDKKRFVHNERYYGNRHPKIQMKRNRHPKIDRNRHPEMMVLIAIDIQKFK